MQPIFSNDINQYIVALVGIKPIVAIERNGSINDVWRRMTQPVLFV